MTVKELIDKLQQFDEDKLVLVEDTEYKEFQAIDVEYDINIGKKYAIEKAKDQIWSGLGFVLQWAINGLKKK